MPLSPYIIIIMHIYNYSRCEWYIHMLLLVLHADVDVMYSIVS